MKSISFMGILLSIFVLAGVSHSNNGLDVAVDIKPQSCPNPFNFESKGALSVAILGTADFDVLDIDPDTILLEGVPPLRWSREDVASPNGECECNEEGADGYLDRTFKFYTQEIAAAIGSSWEIGEVIPLELTGELLDGTAIVGTDCVVVVGSQDDGIEQRVTLCHGGMKTVVVGAGAVNAHLRHGDTLGPCP